MSDGSGVQGTDLYLELLKRTLTRALFEDNDQILGLSTAGRPGLKWRSVNGVAKIARRGGIELVHKRPYDASVREAGKDWPARAETMIGLRRLDNLQTCIESVVLDGVPGDLLEAGVWRGGASIFMRGVLKALGDIDRMVWVADSFQGLPPPEPSRYPEDEGDRHHLQDPLSVGLEQVRHNFDRYGLLDDQVRFLPGWFADTLPNAPFEKLAVLRLDGDMYSSTIQALDAAYPRLSPGGYCIVDDFGAVPGCQTAVHDYRHQHGIDDEIVSIDWAGAFWRKS